MPGQLPLEFKGTTKSFLALTGVLAFGLLGWSWFLGSVFFDRVMTDRESLTNNFLGMVDIIDTSSDLYLASVDATIKGADLTVDPSAEKDFQGRVEALKATLTSFGGDAVSGPLKAAEYLSVTATGFFASLKKAYESEGRRQGEIKSLMSIRRSIKAAIHASKVSLSEKTSSREAEVKVPMKVRLNYEMAGYDSESLMTIASSLTQKPEIVELTSPDQGEKARATSVPSSEAFQRITEYLKAEIQMARSERAKVIAELDRGIAMEKIRLNAFGAFESASAILLSLLLSENQDRAEQAIKSYTGDISEFKRKASALHSLKLAKADRDVLDALVEKFTGANNVLDNLAVILAGVFELSDSSKKFRDAVHAVATESKSFTNAQRSKAAGDVSGLMARWSDHVRFLITGGFISIITCLIILSIVGRRADMSAREALTMFLGKIRAVAQAQESKLSAARNSLEGRSGAPSISGKFLSQFAEAIKSTAATWESALSGVSQDHERRVALETVLTEVKDASSEVLGEMERSRAEITNIVAMISDIAMKTQVINDIAFQTKILSFNASVEAARAGEHGRGFSVVAEEVGKLAGMSGEAAREINRLLQENVARAKSLANTTGERAEGLSRKLNDSLAKANNSLVAASNVSSTLMGTMDSVRKEGKTLTTNLESLAAAVESQLKGWTSWAEDVGQAMSNSKNAIQDASGLMLGCLDGTGDGVGTPEGGEGMNLATGEDSVKIVSLVEFASRKGKSEKMAA